jgi:AraC family transcriptional regulator
MPQPRGSQFGRPLRRETIADVALVESEYDPGLELPRHEHATGYFCLVLRGGFREEAGGRAPRDCGASSVVYRASGEVHRQRYSDIGARCFAVSPPLAWHARPELARLDPAADLRASAAAELMRRLYDEVRASDAFTPLAVEGLALELVSVAARAAAPPLPRRWIDAARELLDAQSPEPVSIAAIARELGVHPSHLARTFRQHFHVTPAEYVRRRRLEHARRLLAEGELSIADVALAAGFYDQSHLTRSFRRALGTTPAVQRRRG